MVLMLPSDVRNSDLVRISFLFHCGCAVLPVNSRMLSVIAVILFFHLCRKYAFLTTIYFNVTVEKIHEKGSIRLMRRWTNRSGPWSCLEHFILQALFNRIRTIFFKNSIALYTAFWYTMDWSTFTGLRISRFFLSLRTSALFPPLSAQSSRGFSVSISCRNCWQYRAKALLP